MDYQDWYRHDTFAEWYADRFRENAGSWRGTPPADAEGPAPETVIEEYRMPVVACTVTDGEQTLTARFQPWCDRANPFVAWEIGDEVGTHGIFHAGEQTVRLGRRGVPRDDGRHWTEVQLDDAVATALEDGVNECHKRHQDPGDAPERVNLPDDLRIPTPAPDDAADRGHVYAFDCTAGLLSTTYLQPWRPPNAAAVYVACTVGGVTQPLGVYHDQFMHLGRRFDWETVQTATEGPVSFPPFFLPLSETEAADLDDDVTAMRTAAPSRALRVVDG